MIDMLGKPVVVQELRKWYPVRRSVLLSHGQQAFVKSVDDVSFFIEEGEVLGLIGESGCGKSTLSRVLLGLEKPTAGKILFKGEDISEMLKREPKSFRRKAQIVMQNPFDFLDPRETIERALSRALELHQIGSSAKERSEICLQGLEGIGLKPARSFLLRRPRELSGGQLQRICILRSMLLKPLLLVADEPVSMLDVSVRADVLNTLLDLSAENLTSILFVSHDISVTRYVSNRIAVMYLGRIVEIGNADDVVFSPAHPYTEALISNSPSPDPRNKRERITLSGEPPTPINPGPGCYFAPRCFRKTKECANLYPDCVDLGGGHLVWCFNPKN